MLLFIIETIDLIHYLANGQIVISAIYLRNNPKDIGLVTHELMHVVQSYPGGQPGKLVEGIADYVRWKDGRDNAAAADCKLPKLDHNQRYTDAYVMTGRFLVWLECKVNRGIVNRLDRALTANQYRNGRIWNQITGKSVNQLWNNYANNSSL